MKHGEVGTGENAHGRWCAGCKHWHGIAYICQSYPETLQTELREKLRKTREIVSKPEWAEEQRRRGVPEEVIGITRFFIGV